MSPLIPTPDGLDEQQSIAQLKSGDVRGLETLVRLYQVRAIRAAYLVVGEYTQAEDIVQAAFLRAYERIQQFDSTRAFGPWFLKSVVNDALKALARQQRQRPPGEENQDVLERLLDGGPALEELVEQQDLQRAIAAALAQLTPAQRAAVAGHGAHRQQHGARDDGDRFWPGIPWI